MFKNNSEKIYLDSVGYNEYIKSIENIKQELQEVCREKIEACRQDPGNLWHDNFMFEESLRREQALAKQLQEKMKNISLIEIVDNYNNKDTIGINTAFTLEFDNQELEEYLLVARQTDFNKNEVSINGPLGKAVFGKKVDDQINFRVDNRIFSAIIRNIII